jgi:hypothetical protein
MLFSSRNYCLAYRADLKTDEPEPLVWNAQLIPSVPQHSIPLGAVTPEQPRNIDLPPTYLLPLVNIEGCRALMASIADSWDEIPNLVSIDGKMPSMERYNDTVSNHGIGKLISELSLAHSIIQTDYLFQVDWNQVSDIYHIYEDEEFKWVHLLVYANQYNPKSIKLAPIMAQEIIDTICNYYHFSRWVMTAVKIDPAKFKSENFVLLRIS